MSGIRFPGVALALALGLTDCASAYGPENTWGGYSEKQVSGAVWWVRYGGNGFTTPETVQTYWLLHCAELTLSNGYNGFRIVSPLQLTSVDTSGAPMLTKISLQAVISPNDSYQSSYKPPMSATIEMLHKPFTPVPGRSFDAAALKAQLEPLVTSHKCGGNVCPYVHTYLFPPNA